MARTSPPARVDISISSVTVLIERAPVRHGEPGGGRHDWCVPRTSPLRRTPMDIVETPRDAAFTVVGINAAVIVPVPPASVEASLAFIRIGNEVFTALQAALAEGWVLQLARDRAALTQGEAPCDEQPAPAL